MGLHIDPFFMWKAVARTVAGAPTPQERVALKANIAGAREAFARWGVTPEEGNGSIRLVQIPFLANAAYVPPSAPMSGIGVPVPIWGDKLLLGRLHEKGAGLLDRGVALGTAKDVVAHEWAHRIVSHLSPTLGTRGQAGTVQESLADTFAAAIDADDWTIGEDALPGGVRSMNRPEHAEGERRAAPGTMRDLVVTDKDRGGVHRNAGIPNKAAAAIGEALGREKMARLYLDAVRNNIAGKDCTIEQAARGVQASANSLFGPGSREAQAVRDAWAAVDVKTEDVEPAPAIAP